MALVTLSGSTIEIRAFEESDRPPVAEITAMLHRAYAPLAAAGMRFFASHQDDAATLERFSKGVGLLAFLDARLVATITWCRSYGNRGVAWYDRPDVATFSQWCVDPEHQGRGIGRALVRHVEQLALRAGARELACDTSERATDLLATYARWGFRVVGRAKWDVTNYESVVVSKTLDDR